MSEFKWHKPEDELPEFGEGDYLLMGKRGALYVACEFQPYSFDSEQAYFYVQNNRYQFLDVKKVKAWAEIPKYGGN